MLNFANASSGFIFSESFATRFFYQQWIQVQSSSEPMQLHKAIGALQFWKPRSLKFKKSRCWWPFGWMHLLGGEAKWPKYLSGFVFALSYMDEYRSIVYSTIPGPHGGDGSFCFFSDRLGCETVKSWFLDRLVAGSMRELSEIATKSGPQRACPYHVCVSNENPQDASVNNIVHMYIYIYIRYPLIDSDMCFLQLVATYHPTILTQDCPKRVNFCVGIPMKPFQNPLKGWSWARIVPFFLRLAVNSYMDRGKSCSKYEGSWGR